MTNLFQKWFICRSLSFLNVKKAYFLYLQKSSSLIFNFLMSQFIYCHDKEKFNIFFQFFQRLDLKIIFIFNVFSIAIHVIERINFNNATKNQFSHFYQEVKIWINSITCQNHFLWMRFSFHLSLCSRIWFRVNRFWFEFS